MFDEKTKSNLLQWPVEEVESLRTSSKDYNDIKMEPGTVMPIDVGGAATQVGCIFFYFLSMSNNAIHSC